MNHTLRRGAMLPLITNGGPHPCIMLTDAYKTLGHGTPEIIQVHLTSSTDSSKYDPTCIFKAGDDPLITKDCWVYYLRAQVRKVADIEAEVVKRGLKVRMISPEIYKLIIQGLLASPRTPKEIREFFEEALSRGLAG